MACGQSASAYKNSQCLYHCVQWPPDMWTTFMYKQNEAFDPCFSKFYACKNSVDKSSIITLIDGEDIHLENVRYDNFLSEIMPSKHGPI